MQTKLSRPDTPKSAARLAARPGVTKNLLAAGIQTIEVPHSREAFLYVPEGLSATAAVPLVISLHGAGGSGRRALDMLLGQAGRYGFCVLAPTSRDQSWDRIMGAFGPDVASLDFCLAYVFKNLAIRPEKLAISGFSDGASYALSIGIENGDLFPNVIAFSPGFAAPIKNQGEPRFFISHGTRDTVLPIDRCSRAVVPKLRAAGYHVDYREFDGPHTVPQDIKEEAIRWWGLTPPAAQK